MNREKVAVSSTLRLPVARNRYKPTHIIIPTARRSGVATAARRDTSKPEPNLTASRFREPDNHCAFIGEVQDAQDCFASLRFALLWGKGEQADPERGPGQRQDGRKRRRRLARPRGGNHRRRRPARVSDPDVLARR
jgi:hypothetical protein